MAVKMIYDQDQFSRIWTHIELGSYGKAGVFCLGLPSDKAWKKAAPFTFAQFLDAYRVTSYMIT